MKKKIKPSLEDLRIKSLQDYYSKRKKKKRKKYVKIPGGGFCNPDCYDLVEEDKK